MFVPAQFGGFAEFAKFAKSCREGFLFVLCFHRCTNGGRLAFSKIAGDLGRQFLRLRC